MTTDTSFYGFLLSGHSRDQAGNAARVTRLDVPLTFRIPELNASSYRLTKYRDADGNTVRVIHADNNTWLVADDIARGFSTQKDPLQLLSRYGDLKSARWLVSEGFSKYHGGGYISHRVLLISIDNFNKISPYLNGSPKDERFYRFVTNRVIPSALEHFQHTIDDAIERRKPLRDKLNQVNDLANQVSNLKRDFELLRQMVLTLNK